MILLLFFFHFRFAILLAILWRCFSFIWIYFKCAFIRSVAICHCVQPSIIFLSLRRLKLIQFRFVCARHIKCTLSFETIQFKTERIHTSYYDIKSKAKRQKEKKQTAYSAIKKSTIDVNHSCTHSLLESTHNETKRPTNQRQTTKFKRQTRQKTTRNNLFIIKITVKQIY